MERALLDMDRSERALSVLETISQELLMRQRSEVEGAQLEGSGSGGAESGEETEETGGNPDGGQGGSVPDVSVARGCRLFHRLMDSLEMTQAAREEGIGSPTVIDDLLLDIFLDAPEGGTNDELSFGKEEGQILSEEVEGDVLPLNTVVREVGTEGTEEAETQEMTTESRVSIHDTGASSFKTGIPKKFCTGKDCQDMRTLVAIQELEDEADTMDP